MRIISFSKLYLISTMLVSAVSLPAHATTATQPGKTKAAHGKRGAATERSGIPAATPKSVGKSAVYLSSTSETFDVKAAHITRGALVTVSQKLLSQAPAGTNPLKVLSQLPGIMFQSAEPQGVDIWSQQLFMHGFQQQQIGFTLDGMPLGEQTLRMYNGLNSLLAISAENVARIDISQSAGAEEIASTSNLGGSFAYVSRDPAHKLGGTINQGFGSYANFHTFLRLDSGDLNKTGTRFFTSYSRQDGQIWKGTGDQFVQQVNAKLLQPIGHESYFSAYFDWADEHQFSTPDTSPEIIQKVGYGVTNYYDGKQSGLQAAINAANGIFPASFAGLADPEDSAYYDATLNSADYLAGMRAHLQMTDHLVWDSTAYGHGAINQSTWTTPYYPSPNGSPLSELRKAPGVKRVGFLSRMQYQTHENTLGGGVWYENNSYQTPQYVFEMPNIVDGKLTSPLPNPLEYWKHPFAQIFNQDYSTNTFTAFVQDTYRPIEHVALHFGFKSVLNTTRVGNGYANPDYYSPTTVLASGVGLTTAKAFLPHISGDWHFLSHHELFFDISENVHTYAQCGYKLCASPFAVTQTAFDQERKSIRPETAWTYAAGYRYSSEKVGLSIYGYRTNFNNRLQQVASGSSVNPISAVSNVGGVTMNGVDTALTVMPIHNLVFTNSFSYDHATYDQNLTAAGTTYDLKGVQVVNYPRYMYKTRLSYDWQGLTAYVDASFNSKRNYSYTGDVKVPSYWLSNLGIQYNLMRIPSIKRSLQPVKDLTLSLSITNLQNTHYIATMGENGNPLSIASGAMAYQSFLIGAPRMAFGSISANF